MYKGAEISTHSRAKAAGPHIKRLNLLLSHFNSQPREGGWKPLTEWLAIGAHFNSQPREGGWLTCVSCRPPFTNFNSQPREGGW